MRVLFLAVAALLAIPAAATPTEHRLSYGPRFGLAEEIVFTYYPASAPPDRALNPYVLSKLDWDILGPTAVEYDFRWEFVPGWRLDLGASYIATPGNGEMKDYDWLAAANFGDYVYEDYTHYSRSEVFISGFGVSGQVHREVRVSDSILAYLGLGLDFTWYHWDDKAYEYRYTSTWDSVNHEPVTYEIGNFGGEAAIIYDQWVTLLTVSTGAEFSVGPLELWSGIWGAPLGFAMDLDQHLFRGIQWYQLYFPAMAAGGSAGVGVDVADGFFLFAEVDGLWLFEDYGPIFTNSLDSDPETSSFGGIARKEWSVSLGVGWNP